MGNSDNVIGYIEYLSDDGKIIGYVTPFTDVDKFRKEILKAAEVGIRTHFMRCCAMLPVCCALYR